MDEYRADFGGSDDKILEFIFHYLEEDYDLETILQQVKEKTMIIKYE